VLQNAKALEIAKGVTLAGAVALSAGSALGEEVFFRGYLQPRVGLLVTSLVFALAHFSYASVSEVAAVFLLALALGGLYRWTGNLWAPIAAHFVFNLVNLVAGIYS
jgi:membrane protease YdiL (CAAX protease family)